MPKTKVPVSNRKPAKKTPPTKRKKADKINESVNMSKVCDRIGKTCKGPIEFYLLEGNRTGFIINRFAVLSEADEGASSSVLMSDDFMDILENEVKYHTMPPDRVVIKTEIDLDLAEVTVDDEKYPIAKYRPPGLSKTWVYLIRVPDIEKYAKEVVNAFVLAILVDRKQEEKTEEGTPEEGGEEPPAEGESPSPPGGDELADILKI